MPKRMIKVVLTVECVAAKYKRAFEQHGRNILGKHARRGASQKAAQVTAPQVPTPPLERRSSVVGDVTKLASLDGGPYNVQESTCPSDRRQQIVR